MELLKIIAPYGVAIITFIMGKFWESRTSVRTTINRLDREMGEVKTRVNEINDNVKLLLKNKIETNK